VLDQWLAPLFARARVRDSHFVGGAGGAQRGGAGLDGALLQELACASVATVDFTHQSPGLEDHVLEAQRGVVDGSL